MIDQTVSVICLCTLTIAGDAFELTARHISPTRHLATTVAVQEFGAVVLSAQTWLLQQALSVQLLADLAGLCVGNTRQQAHTCDHYGESPSLKSDLWLGESNLPKMARNFIIFA